MTRPPPTAAGEVHAHEAAAATVDIVDFAYRPDPVTINAGESITLDQPGLRGP